MARRKGWDNISDSHRRRLTNRGVTRESYESGESLTESRAELIDRAMANATYHLGGMSKYSSDALKNDMERHPEKWTTEHLRFAAQIGSGDEWREYARRASYARWDIEWPKLPAKKKNWRGVKGGMRPSRGDPDDLIYEFTYYHF